MGKQEMRKQLAALSFSEKVKILEKLRARSLAFAEAREKRKEARTGFPRLKKIYCEHGAFTKEMKELGQSGSVELLHFPYDPNSHTRKMKVATASQVRICDLNQLSIEELPGRWADYPESGSFPEILSILGSANRLDALHVDSAFQLGCVAFVTCDRDILDRRTQLARVVGMKFFHPDEHHDLKQLIADLGNDTTRGN